MSNLEQLRSEIQRTLSEVDGVLALRADHGGAAPHLFRSGDNLSNLSIAPKYPLALILDRLLDAHPEARLGVVVRGCDERALIELAKRNQVDLGRVKLIGIACTDAEAEECRCAKPYPEALAIGERVAGVRDKLSARYRTMSLAERRAFWREQFAKCYKCYGCRNICPECFCPECTLEEDIWVERGLLAPPFPAFHLIRAMHMIGRCVGCNQCEWSCPAHIPLTVLYALLREDAAGMFGYEPGRNVEEKPPLTLADSG